MSDQAGPSRGNAGNGRANGGPVSWGPPRRASLVSQLRDLVKPVELDEKCDVCERPIPADHRHMIHLVERRILCVCEPCLALRSGDAEFRPTGRRVLWFEDFELSDELWASFQVPIGLAFFFFSGSASRVVGMYPSPAGATECELYLEAWEELKELNPTLNNLEADIEALVINRLADPHQYAVVPIDKASELVGLIKSKWQGISGGAALKEAVSAFFESIRQAASRL
jgi:hypothetical protein